MNIQTQINNLYQDVSKHIDKEIESLKHKTVVSKESYIEVLEKLKNEIFKTAAYDLQIHLYGLPVVIIDKDNKDDMKIYQLLKPITKGGVIMIFIYRNHITNDKDKMEEFIQEDIGKYVKSISRVESMAETAWEDEVEEVQCSCKGICDLMREGDIFLDMCGSE